VEAGPRFYQAFPYHWLVQPAEAELAWLMGHARAIGLRFSDRVDAACGKLSYHVVCDCRDYTLSALGKKARYDVRTALRSAVVEPIPVSRLASEGWELRMDTLTRQGRSSAETRKAWLALCAGAEDLDGFEAWGVLLEGRLAASLLAFTCEETCSVLYQQSRTEYLSAGVNNALAYTFTAEIMKRPGVSEVFYGLHSADAPPTVDQFKFRMGYGAKPVRQRVVFHPWLQPLVNPATHAGVRALVRWLPGHPVVAKAEGMVRFYLEGRRPLHEQGRPAPLACLEDSFDART
jgi:hypothetical protein